MNFGRRCVASHQLRGNKRPNITILLTKDLHKIKSASENIPAKPSLLEQTDSLPRTEHAYCKYVACFIDRKCLVGRTGRSRTDPELVVWCGNLRPPEPCDGGLRAKILPVEKVGRGV
jgi:hypothetical protein